MFAGLTFCIDALDDGLNIPTCLTFITTNTATTANTTTPPTAAPIIAPRGTPPPPPPGPEFEFGVLGVVPEDDEDPHDTPEFAPVPPLGFEQTQPLLQAMYVFVEFGCGVSLEEEHVYGERQL